MLQRLPCEHGASIQHLSFKITSMHIHLVSIFPSIFDSFLEISLIKKAIDKKLITIDVLDPRSFVPGKGQYVDDEIYGGGAGMLIKAKPIIDSVESIVSRIA